jgi:hypothetical protein
MVRPNIFFTARAKFGVIRAWQMDSHNAVAVVKRVSRQTGKPFVALRSSGLTSFAAALGRDVNLTPATSSEALQAYR